MMISLPGTSALQIKSAISHLFSGDFFYLAPILLSLVTVYSLPWKNYLKKQVIHHKLVLSNYSQMSITFISFVLICVGLFGTKLLFLTNDTSIDYAG